MQTDFNQQGQTYSHLAARRKVIDYGVLQEAARNHLALLTERVSRNLAEADPKEEKALLSIHACLQRFQSFLLQSSRIANHSQAVLRITPAPGEMISAAIDEACIDFESLLFHGRAALDRLTFYLCSQLYNQPKADKFSKLRNVLLNFSKKDPKAEKTLAFLDTILSSLEGTLVDTQFRSLRSALIHRCSVGEITTLAYTVHRLDDGRMLRFDYEVQKRPILATSRTLTQSVTFLVLNTLGLHSGEQMALALEECEPAWNNLSVSFSAFLDPTKAGPRVSVVKMLPTGFELITDHLREDVFDAATEVDASASCMSCQPESGR